MAVIYKFIFNAFTKIDKHNFIFEFSVLWLPKLILRDFRFSWTQEKSNGPLIDIDIAGSLEPINLRNTMTISKVLLTSIEQEFLFLLLIMRSVFLLLLDVFDREFLFEGVLILVLILIAYFGLILLVVVQEGCELLFMRLIFQVLKIDFTDSINHTCREWVKCFNHIL